MNAPSLLIGPTLRYHGNPMRMPWDQAMDIDTDGGVLMVDGKIAEVGAGAALTAAHPEAEITRYGSCLLYTSPSPRDRTRSRMPSSA